MNTINTPCLLYFYDSTGNLQHVIDKFKGLTFNRSWAGVGDFSLTLNPTKAEAASIKTCAFMSINNDARRFGVITGYSEDYTDNMYTLVISGVELKGIAGKRIAYADSCKVILKKPYERVVYTLLNDNLIAPSDELRKLGEFTITFDSTRDDSGTWPTENIEHDAKYNDLATEIKNLAETHDFGWYAEAVLTNGALTGIAFKMREGKNRTLNETQIDNEPLIMSFEDNSVDDITYDGAVYSTPNTAIIGGAGTDTRRVLDFVNGENSGINRNEKFVDARSSKASELPDKGKEALSNYGDNEITIITPSVQLQNSFIAGEFDIGDMGTLRDYSKDMRLTTITEIYEFGYLTLRFEFGIQKANIASALSKLTANYENLVKAEINTDGGGEYTTTRVRYSTNQNYVNVTTSLAAGDKTFGEAAVHQVATAPVSGSTNLLTAGGAYTALQAKQNTLTAGNYITIVNDVISATPFDPETTTIPEPTIQIKSTVFHSEEAQTSGFYVQNGVTYPVYLQRFKVTGIGATAKTESFYIPASYKIIKEEGRYYNTSSGSIHKTCGLPLNYYYSSSYRTCFRLQEVQVDGVYYTGAYMVGCSNHSALTLDVTLYYIKTT